MQSDISGVSEPRRKFPAFRGGKASMEAAFRITDSSLELSPIERPWSHCRWGLEAG
jgi:hypothetical protein